MTKASKQSKPPSKEIAAPYTPTPREEAALDAFKARRMARAPSPRMKVCRKGTVVALAPDHPHRETAQTVLMESLGSADYEFVDGLLAQIGLNCRVDLGTDEYERQLNFMLSVIRSIKPRDEIEAMIASQMAAVHMATMTFAAGSTTLITCRSKTAPNAPSTSSHGPSRPRLKP